jgi:formate/nitrite transporter
MAANFLSPADITQTALTTCKNRTCLTWYKQIILAILAGAFIAFASSGSNVAIHTIKSVGIAKALAGALFAAGLIMVVVAGAELFTGNCLIVMSCLDGQSSWKSLFKNWFFVYWGNFAGALLIVFLILNSGQLNFSHGMLGGFTISIAAYKSGLSFANAFFMGILCNWLVCIAVWMSFRAQDIAGKILAIFFPIWLFITSGFEHSVANMYYIQQE